jgi:hypothetical protein
MSLNEEVFLKELKYDDTILDTDTDTDIKENTNVMKIKIVNYDTCKKWLKNKKKYKHLKSKCESTSE